MSNIPDKGWYFDFNESVCKVYLDGKEVPYVHGVYIGVDVDSRIPKVSINLLDPHVKFKVKTTVVSKSVLTREPVYSLDSVDPVDL